MSCSISIGKSDHFEYDGRPFTSIYNIQVNEDGEFIQDMELQNADELILLRDCLTTYIDSNNLRASDKPALNAPESQLDD